MKTGVLQIVDSLDAGGAEKLAVIIANHLPSDTYSSFLVSTRKEGKLRNLLREDVTYCYLNRKHTLDVKSILRLNRFVKTHNIKIIHAHATSIFTGFLLKLFNRSLVLVWHDHYGNSEFLAERKSVYLKMFSFFMNAIISVNKELEHWSLKKMFCKNVNMLRNASVLQIGEDKTILKGKKGKKITMLAGLRPQKNHMNAMKALKLVLNKYPNTTLHFFGTDFQDEYSRNVLTYIKENKLEESVFYYGVKTDVKNILEQSDIGILSSNSEGLPLSLIEYGLAGLPVAATDVGDSSNLIGDQRFLAEPNNSESLASSILTLLDSEELMMSEGQRLNEIVSELYGIESFMDSLKDIYSQIK